MPTLRYLKIDGAQITFQPQSNFFEGILLLQYLSMRNCWLEKFPYVPLQHLRYLKHLDLSYNKIGVLNDRFNDNFPRLKSLILSNNFIYKIFPGVLQSVLNNGMQKIDLSFNQISNIDPRIIDRTALRKLNYIDLRGNLIRCDCSLSGTFGWLIRTRKLNNSKIPGFIPYCSSAMIDYNGGCLVCDQSIPEKPLSLFTYIVEHDCQELFLAILVVCFTFLVLLFLIIALSCKAFKKQLTNFLLNDVRMQTFLSRPKNNDKSHPVWASDGFVYYDKEDTVIREWVDLKLVPYLENQNPSFALSVVGREDWCGATQVQQTLLRIRASRKTIVLFSDEFLYSPQCQYVISFLEELIYVHKEDRSILIRFVRDDSETPDPTVFHKCPRRNSFSMLKYSLTDDDQLFWMLLTNAMMLPSS